MAENHGTATDIPLTPAISPSVHLSLTIVYTVLYGTLFFIVYVQLWMILYYRHRHFSYESVFLFLCLFWAGLRTTLFSFYFKNCVLVNNLNTFSYWLFYCCPICLQFVTLCLLVVFFAQVGSSILFFHDKHSCVFKRTWLCVAMIFNNIIHIP